MTARNLYRLISLCLVLGLAWFMRPPQTGAPAGSSQNRAATESAGDARQTWGRPDTLPDHFARHGRDFHARDPEDYAAQAAAFLQRAKATGLPAKRDQDGALRIYDPATGAFGAYNSNGTTRTFFKPGSPGYFDHQPGIPVDLRTMR